MSINFHRVHGILLVFAGVQDFVPECKEDGDMTTLETSDVLMDTAASWVKKFPGLRVTNLQTMVRFGDDGRCSAYKGTVINYG